MTEEIEVKAEDVLVDDAGAVIEAPLNDEPPKAEEEDDAPIKAEDESHDEEQGSEGETEEEAEARRERNRVRRRENKERRKDYVESLRREIAARDELLQQQEVRLAAVERRTHGADMAAVDQELQKAADAYNYFKTQHAEAVTNSNGQLATEAFEKMQLAIQRHQQLDGIKKASMRPQTPQQQPLDPRLKVQAEGWLERNSWYDPQAGDMDSKVALSVDQAMAAEGWNPTTTQYWEELDARLKKYLPHRYNSSYNKPQRSPSNHKAPVAGSGRETSNSGNGGYKLSAERVQALKDSGIWDDPKARAEAVKRYKEYDQQGAR